MKRILTFFLACTLCAAAITACSPREETHEHTPSAVWDRDAKTHWQVCECGETLNAAPHTFSDDYLCSVCLSEVWDFGDGVFDVYTYNTYGDCVRMTTYNSDGTVDSETVVAFTYDADGNQTSQKSYENGVLRSETLFSAGTEGFYESKRTDYEEDGSVYIHKYNERGDILLALGQDADGNKMYETVSEYALDEDGNSYESKMTDYDYPSELLIIVEYNVYGDETSRKLCDLEGNAQRVDRYEYAYNEEGDRLWKKSYRDDALVEEITGYKTVITDDYTMRFPEKIIEYEADGGKLITVYGDNGEIETETWYAADGTVQRVLAYTYEYDADGNFANIKVYENERLFTETEYAVDADGWSYKARIIEYGEDGTKTVSEYDNMEELIRVTVYDGDGNEIETP